MALVPSPRLLSLWLPVIGWAALIFAFSSVPDLSSGLGLWDLILRKAAHLTEFAILGALLVRATRREVPAFTLGIAYAVSDEIHQSFVAGRVGSPLDVSIDALGLLAGIVLLQVVRERLAARGGQMRAVAIELDGVLGDTRPLWLDWLEDAAHRYRTISKLEPASLPSDRSEAARVLDRWAADGVGDWRAALGRFAEERAPAYLRPRGDVAAALRQLRASGARVGVFTDAPEPLARAALAHLAPRRIEAVEAGSKALERLRAHLGDQVDVVRSPEELLSLTQPV